MQGRIIPLLLLALFLLFSLLLAGMGMHWSSTGQAPEQPINFSHRIHAGNLELECTHCHVAVADAAQASVPALEICMECHNNVATDRDEIKKLTGYWNRQEPIAWIKVHTLPPHVRFIHKRHIRAGVDCLNCHGEVKAEARIRKVHTLTMGWCVDCHRSRGASDDCATCHK